MPALKSRQKQIPNGLRFSIPEVRWQSTPFASFDTIVNQIKNLVDSNPALNAKYPTDREAIADMVDSANAAYCQKMGWNAYINNPDSGIPDPKPMAPAVQSRLRSVAGAVKRVNAGAALLLDWERNGQPPVDHATAECRAVICSTCPQNGKGDLTRWFTGPASELIRSQLGRLHGLNLSTSIDEQLGICDVCLCPLKLKIWAPLELIKSHIPEDVKAQLPAHCWILK
jgi:hypothetical protein